MFSDSFSEMKIRCREGIIYIQPLEEGATQAAVFHTLLTVWPLAFALSLHLQSGDLELICLWGCCEA